MADLLSAMAALVVILLPLALAWVLLRHDDGRRGRGGSEQRPHGKMPR